MSEQSPAPAPLDAIETVRVRRSPKYAVFLVVGAVLGFIVALILTFTFTGTAEASPSTGMLYDSGQVLGFVSLICIPVGVVVFGVIALVFDRVMSRRARDLAVDHARIRIEE